MTPDRIHRPDLLVQDVLIEKQQSAERLVLCGGRNLAVNGQVGEEGCDVGSAHLCGVALAVKQHEALGPINVGLFGAEGVMWRLQGFPHLVEQFLGPLFLWQVRSKLLALYTHGRQD
jgi:hypothetical protein